MTMEAMIDNVADAAEFYAQAKRAYALQLVAAIKIAVEELGCSGCKQIKLEHVCCDCDVDLIDHPPLAEAVRKPHRVFGYYFDLADLETITLKVAEELATVESGVPA